jgi:hypothetical protein
LEASAGVGAAREISTTPSVANVYLTVPGNMLSEAERQNNRLTPPTTPTQTQQNTNNNQAKPGR